MELEKTNIYIYIYIFFFFFFFSFTHPDEDRQVGRNIGGLYNVSYLHLCLIYIHIYISNTNEDKTHCKDHLYFDQLVGLRQGE